MDLQGALKEYELVVRGLVGGLFLNSVVLQRLDMEDNLCSILCSHFACYIMHLAFSSYY